MYKYFMVCVLSMVGTVIIPTEPEEPTLAPIPELKAMPLDQSVLVPPVPKVNIIILRHSGGKIVDCWKLRQVPAQSVRIHPYGIVEFDTDSTTYALPHGDVKIFTVNADKFEAYKEYHSEFEVGSPALQLHQVRIGGCFGGQCGSFPFVQPFTP